MEGLKKSVFDRLLQRLKTFQIPSESTSKNWILDLRNSDHYIIKNLARMKGNYGLENIKAAHLTMAPKSVFDGQATIPRKAIEFLILSRNGKIRKLSDV